MQPVLLALAVTVMGVKTGWEPVDGGVGLCYIVRLDTFELDVFQRERKTISSSLPPEVLQDLREIRIDMGTTDPPRQPSQVELLRKLEQAKAEKKAAAESGAARDAPDDNRWSPESTKKTLDASSRAADRSKKKGASGKPPADDEEASPKSGRETPATPPPPTRPAFINDLLTKPDGKADAKKDNAKKSDDKKDEPKDQSKASDPKKPASSTPWAIALFISLGGNVCLGWLLWESRVRCRTLLRTHYNSEPLDAEPDAA